MATTFRLKLEDLDKELTVEEDGQSLRIQLDDQSYTVSLEQLGSTLLHSTRIEGQPREVYVQERGGGFEVIIGSRRYPIALGGRAVAPASPRTPSAEAETETAAGWVINSPMAGVVVDVYVSVGNEVSPGALLVIIEAMKMNNEIHARRAGRVEEIYVTKGERVGRGTALLLISSRSG